MKFSNDKPIYLQLADFMLEHILSGDWPPEERVPSVREMAVNAQVTPNTMMRAFNFLMDNEIIYTQRGIGYFVAKDGYEKALVLKRKEFLKHTLPEVFKMMKLLKIDLSELEALYAEHVA